MVDKNLGEKIYDLSFKMAPLGICVISEDGMILQVNKALCQMSGFTKKEIIHHRFSKFFLHKKKDKIQSLLQHPFKTLRIEEELVHKDGHLICVDISMAKIMDRNDDTSYYTIYIQKLKNQIKPIEVNQNDALFKLITEYSQDILSYSLPGGGFQYVSPIVKNILGYEPEELIGKSLKEVIHPDDALNLQFLPKNHGDQTLFECRVRHRNGHYIWFESLVKGFQNEQSDITQIVGIGRDITERKKIEAELQETRGWIESIIRCNGDAIWMMDLEENLVQVNPAFEKIFGWDPQEVIGKPLPFIPEHLQKEFATIHRHVKQGKVYKSLETVRRCKSGKMIYVDVTLSPIRNTEGQVIGITGICRDVTNRKETQEALLFKTEQFNRFIEQNVDGIIIFDKGSHVTIVNHAFEEIFGWKREEIIGLRLDQLPIIPKHLKHESLEIRKAITKGNPVAAKETYRYNRNGERINISLSVFPFYNNNHEYMGWAATLRDITELKKSQELLQNSEKLKVAGELAAGVAHEIRNPMTAIKGFIRLIEHNRFSPDYFNIIDSEIDRIDQILGELLLLAKPQAFNFKPNNLLLLLQQTITLLEPQAIIQNIEIKLDFPSQNVMVNCDANQIKQVFINMIKNAIEAMPDGGQLHIKAIYNDRELILFFTDEGVGIPKHILIKLGQPFYTTKEKGTGLGFMVSKRIIEYHSGSIDVSSQLNIGTTITIKLPIYVEKI